MGKLPKVTKHTREVLLTTLEDGVKVGVIIRRIQPGNISLTAFEKLSTDDVRVMVSLRNAEIGGKLAEELDKTPDRGTAIPDATTEMIDGLRSAGRDKEADDLEAIRGLNQQQTLLKAFKDIPAMIARAAVVCVTLNGERQPGTSLDDLLEMYDGNADLSDFGMGDDFDTLMHAINDLAGVNTDTSAQGIVNAERFPATVG